MPLAPLDTPDARLHRVIDDLTAVRALANLARHSGPNRITLAYLQHLELIVMAAAARVQAYRLELNPGPPPSEAPIRVAPLCVA